MKSRILGMSYLGIIVFLMGGLTLPAPASAVTVFDTMQYADIAGNPIGIFYGEDRFDNFNQPAFQFTASDTVSLDSISFRARPDGTTTRVDATIVRIFTDESGLPGGLLEEWNTTVPKDGLNWSDITVFSTLNPALQAGNNYWVSLSTTGGSGNSGTWRYADLPASDIQRATATSGSAQPTEWFVSSTPERTAKFKVDGTLTSVPVPGAVWLFGSGLLGLIGIARRKKAA